MQLQGSRGVTFQVAGFCFSFLSRWKVQANRCVSVLTGRRKGQSLFEAQGAAERGQTQASCGDQRTFPIYSSHTENNKPVWVNSTLCEEKNGTAWQLNILSKKEMLHLTFENNIVEKIKKKVLINYKYQCISCLWFVLSAN